MSEHNGSAKKTFQSNALITLTLLGTLFATMLLVDVAAIGSDLLATAAMTGLMVAATCWTLTTVQNGLMAIACRSPR